MKKNNLLFIFVLVVSCCLVSCGEKKKAKTTTPQEEFLMGLTVEDTTQILNLSQCCMDTLKAGHIDEALKMLYVMQDGKVAPLPAEKEQQLRKNFKFFPVIDYKLDYYAFSNVDNNDVKFRIEFFKHTGPDDKTPNTIGFMFNPVKIDGTWYLTIKERDQECTNQQ